MTRCLQDVETWMPNRNAEKLQYPLGLRIRDYSPKGKSDNPIRCKKFVYVGSIHPRRKLDLMIRHIGRLPASVRSGLVFSFWWWPGNRRTGRTGACSNEH